MTTDNLTLSDDANRLLRTAIEAARRSLELEGQAEVARPAFDALDAEAADAEADLEYAEPGERRAASQRARHVQSRKTALRRRQPAPELLEDESRWVLDYGMEGLWELVRRDSTMLPEELRRQLAAAVSRCFHPHFESAEALDSHETHLQRLITFMEEMLDPQALAYRQELLRELRAMMAVPENKLADPETSPCDGLNSGELYRRRDDWNRWLEDEQERRLRQSLGTLGFFPDQGTSLSRLQELLRTATDQEVRAWDAASEPAGEATVQG